MQQLQGGFVNGMPKLPALARIRKECFLTQEQLAGKANVARSTIAELELQSRPARFTTMRKLADALGVDLQDLLHDEPPTQGR